MMILLSTIFMIPLVYILNYWVHVLFSLLVLTFMTNISMNFMFLMLNNMFGMDLFSFLMILLSFWIFMLMILASSKMYKKNINKSYFLMVNLILMIVLFMVFSSMNLFIF